MFLQCKLRVVFYKQLNINLLQSLIKWHIHRTRNPIRNHCNLNNRQCYLRHNRRQVDSIYPTCLALRRIFMEKQHNYNLLNLQHSISSFTYLCRYLRLPCYKLRILRHNNLSRCQSILPSRLNPFLCRFLENLVSKCLTYICQLHPP